MLTESPLLLNKISYILETIVSLTVHIPWDMQMPMCEFIDSELALCWHGKCPESEAKATFRISEE